MSPTTAEVTVAYALLRIAEEKSKQTKRIPLCGNCQNIAKCEDADPEDVVCLDYKRREEN